MTLRDLATCPAKTCAPTATVHDAARLMADAGIGFLVVAENGRPVGVLTDRDIVVRAVALDRGLDTAVAHVMTPYAAGVDEHATVERAAEVMADRHCRRLALTAEGRVIGVLSLDDLLGVAGGELQHLARAVRGAGAHLAMP
jgi:CBS domain-containing protein